SKAEATGYDQVIVGYLLQIAAELKTAGSAEAAALRRRTSRLIRTLKPETLQRLVGMGGDFAQRRQFVSDAADGMAVDAVLDILRPRRRPRTRPSPTRSSACCPSSRSTRRPALRR